MDKKINLNSASLEELTTLPGIGKSLAARLIQYRSTVGRFRTVEELAAVQGISEVLINRLGNRVMVGEKGETETDLPPFNLKVTLVPVEQSGDYSNHRLAAFFTRRELVPGVDGEMVSLWVNASTSVVLPKDGDISLSLPNRADLQGEVVFQVVSPDGETLFNSSVASSELKESVRFRVQPKAYASTLPNNDPSFGAPTRLRGRVIDSAGKVQVSNRQVVIWGASSPNPQEADFRALIVVQTDRGGYFSGPYPVGVFTAAFADVSLKEEPEAVAIHLEDGGRFPASVILVVDVDDCMCEEDEDCGCGKESGMVPRDPDMADLARADGVFSSDPGAGQCVDFTKPNRTLEEFTYSYVVRTTQPNIKGLSLEEPEKIDIRQIAGIVQDAQFNLRSMISSAEGDEGETAFRSKEMKAASSLTTQKIDARILQTLARDPDGFTLTKVASAAHLTAHGDLLRLIAKHLRLKPDRTRLSCDSPVDWDEPTIYQACDIAHGHILRFKQEWVADGYSMGNLLYSLPLAPGQKKQVAIVDWERRETSARTEAIVETESLAAQISRDRDINEVVRGAVSENVSGGSSSSTGAFGGGLGLAGGLFGGAGFLGGLLGIGGGTSSAQSNAWQNSSRNTSANALNQLRDRTIQSASSVRSQRSTVVQTVRQGERVTATTESLANYNHCHAITIQYFEVLRHLLVRQRLADVQECLFVPLLMSRFNKDKVLRWRNTLRGALPSLPLRQGLDALERIDNNYVGSDLPSGRYADQTLEYLDGDLNIRFQLARPRDKNDDFDAATWVWISNLLPFINPEEFYKNFLKDQQFKDRVFLEQLGPQIAERFVQNMRFYAVREDNSEVELPIDATRLSDFVNDRPTYVSLRLGASLPPLRRSEIKFIKISGLNQFGIFLINLLPANSRVIVESGTMSYRTKYSSDYLFRNARIQNDIKAWDDVRIFTPLNRQELRNPREEDKELARHLLDHVNEHIERYHHAIWWQMSPDRRYMLMDGFEAPNSGGRSVASVVDNELIGIVGNCLVMPVSRGFHLDPTFRQDIENPIDLLEHYEPNTPIEPMRIALPTSGVYAESVMGACNSCEFKEEERFWRWEESPIPDSPTGILPVSTESRRAEPPDLTAKDFPSPIINLQNAPAAPDPTGLAAAMQLLGTSNLFKDITGLEGTQKNALAAFQGALDTAQFFGGKAADLALQAKMSRDIDKAMRSIKTAKDNGLINDKQAQDLTNNALRGMIGGGTQETAKPMTTDEVAKLANTAGANEAAISVSRPGGEKVSVDAQPKTASLKQPLQERCGFFGPNTVIIEADLREAIRINTEAERDKWFDATGNILKEDNDDQFGQLVAYWLSRFSVIRPATLTALQANAVAAGVNFGQLLVNAATNAQVATEAANVRSVLVAGVPDAGVPANLNNLVEQALRSARASRMDQASTGPWSAVFVTSCIRGTGIQLGLEAMSAGNHVGRDELLTGSSAHRVYVLEAFRRRFGPSARNGGYLAFRPNERTPQVGDIIVQDRAVNDIADVVAFDDIPTTLNTDYALHGDVVVEVSEAGDFVIAIGGNLGNSVRRRRYPMDANRHLVVDWVQLYTQEDDSGSLPNLPSTNNAAGLNTLSTGRIFALLSPVELCAAIPGQAVEGGILV